MVDNAEDDLEKVFENEEMEEQLEKIIDRKVEERLKERTENNKIEDNQERISRRSFLRKLGTGAIGLGALSLLPSSAMNIKSSDGLEVWDSNTKSMTAPTGQSSTTSMQYPTL